ncbi:FliH/SctL family protein [Pseudomonas gingeri]|uniref:HrpE/YscL family type III secretion apparatus protein n=1 Tax=Pseudomonas gingeri TaxID=117681 RepID=A0A7Y7YB40_9PSED|nr:FliH/SctL family protein [Pseudomonas gingeri]NWA02259.1 HrpE/YscL family type III secretion apparatus protein [Pseudomonas gingeri]NWA17872.1 HrpE/YscL family type III secretion apparatus protein [Pseudomonas gingeri]NWA56785.1 HrpE/YscL family type III secretion apparatus protein [Pseudomonas gingeri]NWA97088.1 HrpE/YscL family type III secretion apparatus protein [Pseudomonas gingeri]NWB03711.1 HrpE/YscL family type III secretion apparatus protein [Pseudomonas gingeri]
MSELPSRPNGRILPAAEADAWSEGFAFLQAARDEALAIRNDSQQWLAEARAEGFASAEREGAERAALLLQDTARQVEAYLGGLESALADLALNIAREVMDEMDAGERILRCTRKAMTAFRQDQALTLYVPRIHLDSVRQALAAEQMPTPGLTVEADDQLAAHQARLSSPVGSVELGLDAQLAGLRRGLLPQAEEAQV